MARKKLFDRTVDKEMVERAKRVCKEYTKAKRELPVLEQDLARLAKKRTMEKNKVMRQLPGKGAGTSESNQSRQGNDTAFCGWKRVP